MEWDHVICGLVCVSRTTSRTRCKFSSGKYIPHHIGRCYFVRIQNMDIVAQRRLHITMAEIDLHVFYLDALACKDCCRCCA